MNQLLCFVANVSLKIFQFCNHSHQLMRVIQTANCAAQLSDDVYFVPQNWIMKQAFEGQTGTLTQDNCVIFCIASAKEHCTFFYTFYIPIYNPTKSALWLSIPVECSGHFYQVFEHTI